MILVVNRVYYLLSVYLSEIMYLHFLLFINLVACWWGLNT